MPAGRILTGSVTMCATLRKCDFRKSGYNRVSAIDWRAFVWKTFLCGRYVAIVCLFAWSHAQAQTRPISLPLETQWTNIPTAPSLKEAAPQSAVERLSVGVGDQIFITVFGQPDMSAEVTVNDNDQVTLPLIGTLKIGGLTPQTIEKLIAQRLKDGEYLRNPEVSVQVRQVRSQMISVLGEVLRPGRFPILGKLTVLDAVATAGGLTQRADSTALLIRRNPALNGDIQRKEIPIRLDQVMDSRSNELNIELKNDDVVFVAQQKLFYIHGEVRKPGAYPMEPDLNVMRVLSISGGVTDRGSLRRIRIHRKDAGQNIREFTPELNSAVLSGDVIFVDERLF